MTCALVIAAIGLAACFGDDRNRGNADANANPTDPDARADAPKPDAGPCTPHDELCNGLDDDCDDDVDEDWPVGDACTVPTACPPQGQYVCTANGAGVICNAMGDGEPEICGDGIDNDCMGGDEPCVANDTPAGAIDVSAGGTFVVDLSNANDDHDSSCGGTAGGGRDVFYELTLPTAEVVYLDTLNSNFDSVLSVFDGACTTSLGPEVACEDDDCNLSREQAAWSLTAGMYCIVVDQYDDAEVMGMSRLVVTLGGRTGTRVTGAGSVSGSTSGDANRSDPSCVTDSTAPEDAYFFTVCPSSTTVTADTCDATTTFDTVLYARRGNGVSGPGNVACDDDDPNCAASTTRSSISFTTSTPGLYWLIVDGYQTNAGSYRLRYDTN